MTTTIKYNANCTAAMFTGVTSLYGQTKTYIQCIHRDQDWWQQQLPKLKHFYFRALFLELAYPMKGKGEIREPATDSYP